MTDTLKDSSPSWLKQRTTLFNNATSKSTTMNDATTQPAVKKVVDKELASLKKIGAVSSVWTNKFIQEDNSGGSSSENKRAPTPRNFNITSPPLHPLQYPSSDPTPTSRRINKVNTTPLPNADYIHVSGARKSFSSNSSVPPTLSLTEKSRSFSGTKSISEDIQQVIDQHQLQQNLQKQKSLGYFSKASMSSLDLNDVEDSNRSSSASISTNGFSSPPFRTSAETDRTSFAKNNIDEAAALWFQCETLKTQYAQKNAKLNKATEEVEYYKRQLDKQGEISRQSIANAVQEKEKEVVRVHQLVEVIVKQDKLLDEYQVNLDTLAQLANESTYVEKAQAEMQVLRQEVASFKKQKKQLEDTVAALHAELEMNQAHKQLMMTVSIQIQNDFQKYKNKINVEIKDLLKQKQIEHETELKVIQEKLAAAPTADRSVSDAKSNQEVETLRDQIILLTEELKKKDKAVLDLESQLESQKTSMDSQMMELTQDILEKDALLMELMSSNDSGREALNEQREKSDSRHQDEEKRHQMSQIRNFMYNISDDNEEEEQEPFHYTSEEEGSTFQDIDRYHQLMTHENITLQSPAESVSSSVNSFDSSTEEEKVAEIKHFSYSSVQSQQTRPHSLNSTTESITANQDIMDDVNRRLSASNVASHNSCFSVAKEKKANWPMPPPTPPPSEPLPPVPATRGSSNAANVPVFIQEKLQSDKIIPPPRRARSNTVARAEAPNMSLYTTSTHQDNQLPRVIPLQKDSIDPTAPIPPLRKSISPSSSIQQSHTKWMDDPESEEDDMCNTNTTKVAAW
ncbi:hypothetical protein [Parasitella parasitica]|uniref:Uncharacterized protein n=1 Tax=Parasitella parasitica TaxID=35722 RepID=A0A0B7NS85_9FUNG|nr:hypothetical protein [Parasitella parasitica]